MPHTINTKINIIHRIKLEKTEYDTLDRANIPLGIL